MNKRIALLLTSLLAACASYDGRGLQPGLSTVHQVEALMGTPALRWRLAEGGEQLAYPRGALGHHTYMVMTDVRGTLISVSNVLETRHFARIREGMSQNEVLQILGPPVPEWTTYFERRDELVWEWRYCDDWSESARFYVYFDGHRGTVRSTGSLTEKQRSASPWRITCGR